MKKNLLIELIIRAPIICICEYFRQNGVQCGIPVLFWFEMDIILERIAIINNVLVICGCIPFMWNNMVCHVITQFIFGTIQYIALVCWTIYGYSLYFSPENDC